MASTSLFRTATRAVRPCSFFRAPQLPRSRVQTPSIFAAARANNFSTTCQRFSGAHDDETFEEFSARYSTIVPLLYTVLNWRGPLIPGNVNSEKALACNSQPIHPI